jgi:multisubunit Na+/H+ antiporter MnhB subunit
MKNLLILIAFIIATVAIYFLYDWYKSDPQNKEPFPALLSAISALIMFIVAWRYDGSATSKGGSFFSFNKTNIKGSGNTVNQGAKDNPTIDIKKTSIEGDKNKLDQSKANNP